MDGSFVHFCVDTVLIGSRYVLFLILYSKNVRSPVPLVEANGNPYELQRTQGEPHESMPMRHHGNVMCQVGPKVACPLSSWRNREQTRCH